MQDPYDELPYRAVPIEHTAPERIALASLLHGGPRLDVHAGYRVLELGCADGANLLPMAWFRRHASFVGVDGASTQIERAREHAAALGLSNLEYVHARFEEAAGRLEGQFDLILAHGVFSWIPRAARDALLGLCVDRLRPGGLFYVNYNAMPGWNVRGMVRELVLAQTAGIPGLRARAEAARDVCRRLVDAMGGEEHAYRRLVIDELCLVRDGDLPYVAHEYLARDNHAYWRSDFAALVAEHGLVHVADADFDQPWARTDGSFDGWLRAEGITGRSLEDTMDFLLYRQLCSPILALAPLERHEPTASELTALFVASRLAPKGDPEALPVTFAHPGGVEVTVRDPGIRDGLRRLLPEWPRGLRVGEAFARPEGSLEDLRLLHRHGLVELRVREPEAPGPEVEALHRIEVAHGGYRTSAGHTRQAAEAEAEAG